MKNLLLALLIAFGLQSFAQNTIPDQQEGKFQVQCKKVYFSKNFKKMTFTDVNYFKTDIIEIKNADRIFYDQDKEEIQIRELVEFTFDGALQISARKKMKKLRYKIGDRIVYIE